MLGTFVLRVSLPALIACCACGVGCEKSGSAGPQELPDAYVEGPAIVPRAINATPVADEAGTVDGKSPLEQAQGFYAEGQLWMGRLVLEQRALGPSATKDETALLAKICADQRDASCLEACSRKLGRKLSIDATASDAGLGASDAAAPIHAEPDTELARERDLVLKKRYADARKAIEPKVLDGSASSEEVRLLRAVCTAQADRMCVALCDTKLAR